MAVLNLSCSMLSVTALMALCTSRICSGDGAPSPIRPSPARFFHTRWRKRCMPMMSRGSHGLEASSGPMYISYRRMVSHPYCSDTSSGPPRS
jgi:hypothetical protein